MARRSAPPALQGTARGAARVAERAQAMLAMLGQGREGEALSSAAVGVRTVVEALQQAARAALAAKATDGMLPATVSYRSSLDAVRRALVSAITTRRDAERLIAWAFDASLDGSRYARTAHHLALVETGVAPIASARQDANLRDLMAAADALLVAIDAARSVLDVPDGTGRCRRALIARAHAAAFAADAHAIRTERISARLTTPNAETPAFTRRQAQLAHGEVARIDALVQSFSDDRPTADACAHNTTLLFHASCAEAYEQVARAASALAGIQYAAERVRPMQHARIRALQDEATAVIDACSLLCGQITDGNLGATERLQRRADKADQIEDIFLELLHPTAADLGTLFGSGPYAATPELVRTA